MSRKSFALAFVVAIATVASVPAHADDRATRDATFRHANEDYFKGKYAEAIAQYEQIAALGVSSQDLFFNLGNAYFKNGALGPAIYNYERALMLDATGDDVQFNLKAAREAARKKGEDRLVGAEVQPLWLRLIHAFPLGLLSWIFLGLYIAVFGLLLAIHFVQPGFLRVVLWSGFAFIALAALASGALTAGNLYAQERVVEAVVLPDLVPVKEGPDANYQSLFKVHAGLKVRIIEKDQDWLRVRLSNGLEGWLREREVGRL